MRWMIVAAGWWVLAVAASFSVDMDGLFPQPKFEVRISDTLKEPFVPMLINGTEYQCHVPTKDQWVQKELPREPSPAEVLEASLLIGGLTNCTYRVEEYWGYKLCHNNEIWQIHPESSGSKYVFHESSPSFFLGNITQASPEVSFRNGKWSLKVSYPGGEVCDLTGEPRHSSIFYVCDENESGEVLRQVRETHACVYEFTVATDKVCNIFKTPADPINFIECYTEPEPEPEHDPEREQRPEELASTINAPNSRVDSSVEHQKEQPASDLPGEVETITRTKTEVFTETVPKDTPKDTESAATESVAHEDL